MDSTALRAFVDRSQALGDATPPTSRTETRSWLVDPFLAVLGWDVRSETCREDLQVGNCRLEYVLSAASTPAVLVAVEPYRAGLEADRARNVRTVMAQTGVDRAIYTDGATVALAAGEDHLECRLADLPEYADELTRFSKDELECRLEDEPRSVASRRLAIDREPLAGRITDELTAVAGERLRSEFRAVTEGFLDHLQRALTDGIDDSDCDDPTIEESTTDGTNDPPSTDAEDGDGEYVVRFFADRGSIGAVGHSNPEDALAEATRYLFERGLTGVRTPWPDDGTTVLNDTPTLADGSPMPAFRELPNGLYLNTDGDADELARRVVAMADRAGLRAMVTGDWGR